MKFVQREDELLLTNTLRLGVPPSVQRISCIYFSPASLWSLFNHPHLLDSCVRFLQSPLLHHILSSCIHLSFSRRLRLSFFSLSSFSSLSPHLFFLLVFVLINPSLDLSRVISFSSVNHLISLFFCFPPCYSPLEHSLFFPSLCSSL